MGDKSKIEWTNATWNPVTGCTKVSAGCRGCYAERHARRFWGDRKFTDVQTHNDRLDQPLRWKKPRMIFVNSMSDLFHESVPYEFINKVFQTMYDAKQHTFQILTKRPVRMFNFVSSSAYLSNAPLENVWLGVSCENQETTDERIPVLLQTPAAVRFISAEPLIGKIDLKMPNGRHDFVGRLDRVCEICNFPDRHPFHKQVVDWVIAGGESGPHARPCHPHWIRSLRDQCKNSGVPFFFKQWGEWKPIHHAGHTNWCTDEYGETTIMSADGAQWDDGIQPPTNVWSTVWEIQRIGKTKAGNTLDGIQHKEFPRVHQNHQ